jgi:hypothetical protein
MLLEGLLLGSNEAIREDKLKSSVITILLRAHIAKPSRLPVGKFIKRIRKIGS